MVKSPNENSDIDDYDDPAEYIDAALEEGWTLEADDFEGRPCAFCGELIDYADVMGDPDHEVPTYDIQVADPDAGEDEPYVDRHYFCSTDCRKSARGSVEWHLRGQTEHAAPDWIHVDDVDGVV